MRAFSFVFVGIFVLALPEIASARGRISSPPRTYSAPRAHPAAFRDDDPNKVTTGDYLRLGVGILVVISVVVSIIGGIVRFFANLVPSGPEHTPEMVPEPQFQRVKTADELFAERLTARQEPTR